MSQKKDYELNAFTSIVAVTDDLDRRKEALDQFNALLPLLLLCTHSILNARLKQAVTELNAHLQALRSKKEDPPSTQDLQLAIRLITLLISHGNINPMSMSVAPNISASSRSFSHNNQTFSKPKNEAEYKVALKAIVKEMEVQGPRWGKILGAVLIIAGILLSIASFATMIPSFGASTAAVPVAITWTLAGLSFFSTSIGAGAEYLSRDTSTDLSAAIDQVIKVF